MAVLFISYRRKDDPYAARGIANALAKRFGKRNVYFDLDAMRAGLDFRTQIDEMVAKSDVMVVVIGDNWLQTDESGRSRLEDPDDLASLEVSSALKRNIPVIPVLVGAAMMPDKSALPEHVRALAYRQVREIRATANFEAQMTALIESIEAVAPAGRSTTAKWLTVGAVGAMALTLAAWIVWRPKPAPAGETADSQQPATRNKEIAVSNLGNAPMIEILDPIIPEGREVRLAEGVTERLIAGRAKTTGKLRDVTVNGTKVSLNESGFFTATIRVSDTDTDVTIVAVNEAGHGSIRSFVLKPFGSATSALVKSPIGLIVAQLPGCPKRDGSCDDIWDENQQHALTYCVSTSFGSRHERVVKEMAAATGAWEEAADIDFIHVDSQDGNCGPHNTKVVFDVRPIEDGSYLARAFYPREPRERRNVLIDSSAFELRPNEKLQLVGVLRSILGQALGFRHEHTRPESGTCFEDNDWRALGSYNPRSVTHYPQCNGLGDWSFLLTQSDKNGAACLYGAAKGFNIDPSTFTTRRCPRVRLSQT